MLLPNDEPQVKREKKRRQNEKGVKNLTRCVSKRRKSKIKKTKHFNPSSQKGKRLRTSCDKPCHFK